MLVSCGGEDATTESTEQAVSIQTDNEKVSYVFGQQQFMMLQQSELSHMLEDEAFMKGMDDARAGAMALVTMNEALEIIEANKPLDPAIAAGTAFLEANGAREGVVTTPSGLQYEILTEGTGAIPVATDEVLTHYHGTFIDGTVFDSSVDRGEPISFGVTGVIQGWIEALQMMPVGSKWKLTIPYELAYGEQGRGASMPPYSVLIFDIELLEIVAK